MKALHETEETNARLHMYIEGLLANIIDKYPELLEKRWAGYLEHVLWISLSPSLLFVSQVIFVQKTLQ